VHGFLVDATVVHREIKRSNRAVMSSTKKLQMLCAMPYFDYSRRDCLADSYYKGQDGNALRDFQRTTSIYVVAQVSSDLLSIPGHK
jgi:hypothetical protein